jgi:phosphohistidine phosphatase
MKLYLMRHGDATKDEPRVLSKRGRKESKKAAKILCAAGIKPSELLCSSAIRAGETAEIVSRELGVPVEKVDGLNPEDDAHLWLDRIGEKDEDIMLVGHLPNLSHLASLLLTGEERDLLDFRKSSVACLESSGDAWIIRFFVTPEIV